MGSAEANFLKNAVCLRREKERVAEAAMKVGSIGDRGGSGRIRNFKKKNNRRLNKRKEEKVE